jgi:hypothetical protein
MTNNNSDSPQCGNCVAWYDGECRPSCAQAIHVATDAHGDHTTAAQSTQAFWPETDESDYCMEWVRDPGEDQAPTKVISS